MCSILSYFGTDRIFFQIGGNLKVAVNKLFRQKNTKEIQTVNHKATSFFKGGEDYHRLQNNDKN